jgi:hypothetical protein
MRLLLAAAVALAALRCACARPFTPELDAAPGAADVHVPGAHGRLRGGAARDSAAAHVAAHAAAAVAHGASFWRADIVLVLTWHDADIAWLAELPLRHVRARAAVLRSSDSASIFRQP